MMLPSVNDEYPMSGAHAAHVARIVAVDLHGFASWDDGPHVAAPTLRVACECGVEFVTELPEAVAA